MSPEAQNRAICKALGKRYHKPTPEEIARGSYYHYQYEPDYLNDLNAMHSAEQVREMYSYPQRERYLDNLMTVVRSENIDRPFCCATAAQRCEAFLKTLGLWK